MIVMFDADAWIQMNASRVYDAWAGTTMNNDASFAIHGVVGVSCFIVRHMTGGMVRDAAGIMTHGGGVTIHATVRYGCVSNSLVWLST